MPTSGPGKDRPGSKASFTECPQDPVQSLPWPRFAYLHSGEAGPSSKLPFRAARWSSELITEGALREK